MKDQERAQQFWSVLSLAARNQQLVSYNTLFKLTGMAKVGVGRPLGHIAAYCHQKKLPRLNIIAVSEESGKPEAEFLQDVNLLTEQARVFVYDWIGHGAPNPEEFEQAYATAKATGHFVAANP
jgi:hypothetical protein